MPATMESKIGPSREGVLPPSVPPRGYWMGEEEKDWVVGPTEQAAAQVHKTCASATVATAPPPDRTLLLPVARDEP